jgi:hypothetical protein
MQQAHWSTLVPGKFARAPWRADFARVENVSEAVGAHRVAIRKEQNSTTWAHKPERKRRPRPAPRRKVQHGFSC